MSEKPTCEELRAKNELLTQELTDALESIDALTIGHQKEKEKLRQGLTEAEERYRNLSAQFDNLWNLTTFYRHTITAPQQGVHKMCVVTTQEIVLVRCEDLGDEAAIYINGEKVLDSYMMLPEDVLTLLRDKLRLNVEFREVSLDDLEAKGTPYGDLFPEFLRKLD